jgi:hypothetical protein
VKKRKRRMIQSKKGKAEGRRGGLMELERLIRDMNLLQVFKVIQNLKSYNKIKKNLNCQKINHLCKN